MQQIDEAKQNRRFGRPVATGRRASLLCAILLLAMAGCAKKSQDGQVTSAPAFPPAPVRVALVSTRSVPVQLSNIGVVQPVAAVTLQSQVDGQLTRVNVKPGQNVKKGEILFQLDPAPFRAALLQAQATLLKDEATAQNDRVIARQQAQMLKLKAASPTEYLTAKYTAQAADAQVKADAALVQTARINLDYCTIRAPMNARAGNLQAFVGENIKAITTNLLTLNQLEPIYVAFSLPQSELPRLFAARKRKKHDELAVAAAIPGDTGPPITGRLVFLDNQIDQATGTINLMASFQNLDHRLWPGELVDAVVTLQVLPKAIVVPSQAVQVGQNGDYVYVVNQRKQAVMQPVTQAFVWNSWGVISKGLSPGQTVVTDGQLAIIPGHKVTIVRHGLIAGPSGPSASPSAISANTAIGGQGQTAPAPGSTTTSEKKAGL